MLVFHQKAIVESLKTHLAVENSLAYQPLLEWVVSTVLRRLCLPEERNCCLTTTWFIICSSSVTPVVSLLFFPLQPGGATCQRPADWLLPSLSRLLHSGHVTAGHKGHGGPGVGFHLSVLPLQVPVEAHGEGHDQHLQVGNKAGVRLCGGFTCKSVTDLKTSFLPTVYTAHCWHTRKSTSASLQQRASLF